MNQRDPERRELWSVAVFYVGEVLRLRPDMGGGRWRVVQLLPGREGRSHCLVERLPE